MNKKSFTIFIISFFFILLGFLSFVNSVSADTCNPPCQNGQICKNGSCVVSQKNNDTTAPVKLHNPLGDNISTPEQLIGKIINSLLGLVGSLSLLMFVYGGLIWMTSSGSQEKVKKGRDIIMWSALGLIVVFSSYGLIRFLLSNIAS